MDTAIISLLCIALVVFGGMTMAQGFITSVDASTSGLEEIGQRDEQILRTELTPLDAAMGSNDTLELIVENTGQTKLSDFDQWDIIVQYYDGASAYHIKWLPYADGSPGNGEWGVSWIRVNGSAELFEQGILNPGEQIMLTIKLDPAVGPGTTNLAVVSTPSGITASIYFSP